MKTRGARVKAAIAIAFTCLLLFKAESCEESKPTAADNENKSRLQTYEGLTKKQPALKMDYSPTRATKNFWIKTWDEPGKLSYVYLMNANGDTLGYYIFEGLPVSYCTSLIPPVQKVRVDGGEYNQDVYIPGPSVDGTYSSSSNCNTYYGKDANTGSYLEYTVGTGLNVLVFEEPMPRQGGTAFGPTTVDNVKK